MYTCTWLKCLDFDSIRPTPPYPHSPTTIYTGWRCLCACVWTYEIVCVAVKRAPSSPLPSTWMGAVSEMEVLMISVLEDNQIPFPGECRFYDSVFQKSEVTSAHTLCWATKNLFMCGWSLYDEVKRRMNLRIFARVLLLRELEKDSVFSSVHILTWTELTVIF